jgi:hypothetical protein
MTSVWPRVSIVSPALAGANNGNWHTAARWQRFLAPVAQVEVVAIGAEDGDADLLIALHARRSAASIARWRARRPDAPIVLVLTGTDLYRDLDHDADARHSLECASRIVVLQEAAPARLDAASRAKATVIVQSASALHAQRSPRDADLVAVGHLREEKDPATLLGAARLLAHEWRRRSSCRRCADLKSPTRRERWLHARYRWFRPHRRRGARSPGARARPSEPDGRRRERRHRGGALERAGLRAGSTARRPARHWLTVTSRSARVARRVARCSRR